MFLRLRTSIHGHPTRSTKRSTRTGREEFGNFNLIGHFLPSPPPQIVIAQTNESNKHGALEAAKWIIWPACWRSTWRKKTPQTQCPNTSQPRSAINFNNAGRWRSTKPIRFLLQFLLGLPPLWRRISLTLPGIEWGKEEHKKKHPFSPNN